MKQPGSIRFRCLILWVWGCIPWLIIPFLAILLSCSGERYYEYEVVNHSNGPVTVKIETNSSQFRKNISYVIERNKTKRIFEHKPYDQYLVSDTLKPLTEPCKYFAFFSITNSEGKLCKRDFFCKGCSEFRVFKGMTGQQGIMTLVVTEKDFE